MKKYFLILTVICLFSSIAWSEEMYFWTDANGKKHYGDAPPNEQKSQVESMKAHKFNEREHIEAEYKRSEQQSINEYTDRQNQYADQEAKRQWKAKQQSNTVQPRY